MGPDASFVIPAYNEEDYIGETVQSINNLDTGRSYEILVVDGGSTDRTRRIAVDAGARVVEQEHGSIGAARHRGACAAEGEYLAFIDADTTVREDYLDAMIAWLEQEELFAATSRMRMDGDIRRYGPQLWMNHVLPHLPTPVLPGFNVFMRRQDYMETSGFPDVPNEDVEFSKELALYGEVGRCPLTLVENSGRRVQWYGLFGYICYYLWLEYQRLRTVSSRGGLR